MARWMSTWPINMKLFHKITIRLFGRFLVRISDLNTGKFIAWHWMKW